MAKGKLKLKEKKTPFEIGLITWCDTSSIDGWFGKNDLIQSKPLVMKTLGWIVKQDEVSTVVARTAGEHKVEGLLVIPNERVVTTDILK